jgi:hypothetical protein
VASDDTDLKKLQALCEQATKLRDAAQALCQELTERIEASRTRKRTALVGEAPTKRERRRPKR